MSWNRDNSCISFCYRRTEEEYSTKAVDAARPTGDLYFKRKALNRRLIFCSTHNKELVSARFSLPTNTYKKFNGHGTTNLYLKQLASDSLPTNTYKKVNGYGTTNLYLKQLASDSLSSDEYLQESQQSQNHKPLPKTVSVRFSVFRRICLRESIVTEPNLCPKQLAIDSLPTNIGTEVNSHGILNFYPKQLASDFLPTNLFKRVNGHGTTNLYPKQLASDSRFRRIPTRESTVTKPQTSTQSS